MPMNEKNKAQKIGWKGKEIRSNKRNNQKKKKIKLKVMQTFHSAKDQKIIAKQWLVNLSPLFRCCCCLIWHKKRHTKTHTHKTKNYFNIEKTIYAVSEYFRLSSRKKGGRNLKELKKQKLKRKKKQQKLEDISSGIKKNNNKKNKKKIATNIHISFCQSHHWSSAQLFNFLLFFLFMFLEIRFPTEREIENGHTIGRRQRTRNNKPNESNRPTVNKYLTVWSKRNKNLNICKKIKRF